MSLDEILERYGNWVMNGAVAVRNNTGATKGEAKDQIKTLMLEIIGEDEFSTDSSRQRYHTSSMWYRNKLKAELRERIKEL